MAGLIPTAEPVVPAAREIVTHAAIVHVAVARIAPQPKPTPVPMRAIRPQIHVRARPGRGGRRSAAVHLADAPRVPLRLAASRPIWDVGSPNPQTGTATGAGTQTGAGSGSGNAGNGSGTASGNEPCGFVEFSDPHGSRFDPNSHGFYVDIKMSVHYADGSTQAVLLDYPWYYASEAANPWSAENLRDPNFPTRFQAPPSALAGSEPPIVQYVAQHSTSDGLTLLRDCPGAAAQPQ